MKKNTGHASSNYVSAVNAAIETISRNAASHGEADVSALVRLADFAAGVDSTNAKLRDDLRAAADCLRSIAAADVSGGDAVKRAIGEAKALLARLEADRGGEFRGVGCC